MSAARGVRIAAVAASGKSVYVSPSGNDANDGLAPARPVKTLARAQAVVRGLNGDMSGDITVTLADGYYRLSKPLILTAADSGTYGNTRTSGAALCALPVDADM